MLEALVYWNGPPPGNQHFVEIGIPAGTSYEVVGPDTLPDWHLRDSPSARRFGHQWYAERRSAILIVPSRRRPAGAQHHHQRESSRVFPVDAGTCNAGMVG